MGDFYDYERGLVNKRDGSSLVISVDGIIYTIISDDFKGERVIRVVDTNDEDTSSLDISFN